MVAKKKRQSKKKWMQGAVKRPGQLHRDLGVPKGKKIPKAKVKAAAKKKGKVGQRARFALNASKTASKGGKRKRRVSKKKRK
jgi:hypothetical protein